MEPNRFLRILRKGWPYIAAFAVLGLVGGAIASALTPVQYASTTRLYVTVQIQQGSTTGELVQGNNFAAQKVLSYVDVVTSPRVLDPVIADLALDTTAEDLARDVSAEVQPNSVIIGITANGDTAAEAAELASTTATEFARVVVTELELPADGSPSPIKVEVLQPALEPGDPAQPQVPLLLTLGLAVGLIVGVMVALLIGLLDRRVHGRVDFSRISDLPVLGSIPTTPRMRKKPLVVREDARGATAEAFRTLRTSVQSVGFDGASRSLVVTSSLPGEGKTSVVANLAASLADAGSTVIVVDADLRGPGLAGIFALPGEIGLTEVLTRRVALDEAIQAGGPRLAVLASGSSPANPSELLGSSDMAALLATLTQRFDYVLIDAPSVLPVTDATVLSRLAGATIVTVGASRVKDEELLAAVDSLETAGGTVIGVVLTMLPTRGADAGVYRGRSLVRQRTRARAVSAPATPMRGTSAATSVSAVDSDARPRLDGEPQQTGRSVTTDREPKVTRGA